MANGDIYLAETVINTEHGGYGELSGVNGTGRVSAVAHGLNRLALACTYAAGRLTSSRRSCGGSVCPRYCFGYHSDR
jgi:hypothetical protein